MIIIDKLFVQHLTFQMPAIRVVSHLKQTIEVYGKPLEIRVDNGVRVSFKAIC